MDTMDTIAFRLLGLPLALGLALASSACIGAAESDDAHSVTDAPTGTAAQAWWRWSYGPPGLGFPLWCDATGACYSPAEGDIPWL
jgi:hypothetical protein